MESIFRAVAAVADFSASVKDYPSLRAVLVDISCFMHTCRPCLRFPRSIWGLGSRRRAKNIRWLFQVQKVAQMPGNLTAIFLSLCDSRWGLPLPLERSFFPFFLPTIVVRSCPDRGRFWNIDFSSGTDLNSQQALNQ